MEKFLWGIVIFCFFGLNIIWRTTIAAVTASKPVYFTTIFDFIGVIFLMLQNPIVWILLVVMLLCMFGASKC